MPFSRCQVCGFPVFEVAQHLATWEAGTVCPCCATHYGRDDQELVIVWASLQEGVPFHARTPEAHEVLRREAWRHLRSQWLHGGMRF